MPRSETAEVLAYVRHRLVQEHNQGATWRALDHAIGINYVSLQEFAKAPPEGPEKVNSLQLELFARHWEFKRVSDLYVAAAGFAEKHPELFASDAVTYVPDDPYPHLSEASAILVRLGKVSQATVRDVRLGLAKGQHDQDVLDWMDALRRREEAVQYALRNPGEVAKAQVAQQARLAHEVSKANAKETPKQKSARILAERAARGAEPLHASDSQPPPKRAKK